MASSASQPLADMLVPARWGRSARRRRALVVALALLLLAAFDVTYGQAPLYNGNQGTYLLTPLADAGLGYLEHDWLANTADRMPVTSLLVRLTVEHLGEWPLYLYQAALMGVYGLALVALGAGAMRRPTPARLWVLVALLFLGHVAQEPSVLFRGAAGQSVLFQVFEPALFGVFLVLSLALFDRDRPVAAAACLAVAATAHPTYLLPGVIVAGAYAGVLWLRERRPGRAAALLAVYGLGAAPIAVYSLVTFAPTSPALHAQAAAILADQRIPYHADPAIWFNAMDVVRVGLVLAAAWVVRRTRLAPVLVGVLAAGVLLTLARVVVDSPYLALLFPWRVSVLLVPAATAILLGAIVDRGLGAAADRSARASRIATAAALVAIAVATGLRVPDFIDALDGHPGRDDPLVAHVTAHKRPHDVFLLPVGARLADIGQWEDFRLLTGAPIFVDLKHHPLRDAEVVQWWGRVQTARRLYDGGFPPCEELRRLQASARVSAVVVWRGVAAPPPCPGVRLEHRGPDWSVYRLAPVARPVRELSRRRVAADRCSGRSTGPTRGRWPRCTCDRWGGAGPARPRSCCRSARCSGRPRGCRAGRRPAPADLPRSGRRRRCRHRGPSPPRGP